MTNFTSCHKSCQILPKSYDSAENYFQAVYMIWFYCGALYSNLHPSANPRHLNKQRHYLQTVFHLDVALVYARTSTCSVSHTLAHTHTHPTPELSVLQVFDFQHRLLFGEMYCLQVSAVNGMIAPPLELSVWGPAPTPVLQVTQGSRHRHPQHTDQKPAHWYQRQRERVTKLFRSLF